MNRRQQALHLPLPQLPQSWSSLAMVAGFGLVGVSAFALLAAGPRVLGQSGYSALAVAWTIVTIVGIGVASPGEQVVTRGIAAETGAGTYRAVRRRFCWLAPVLLLVGAALGRQDPEAGGHLIWIAALALATVCWFWLALVRGVLAGRHQFAAYSATLAVEAVARTGLVGLALLVPDHGAALLAAAVAIPLLVSAALGWLWTRGDPAMREEPVAEESRGEHFSMTSVAMLIQVCLSTAQLWLNQQSPDAAVSGAFVTAASYMRIPTLLAGGLYAPLLTAAAQAYVERLRGKVLAKTGEAVLLGVGGSTLLVVVLLALRGPAMSIFYGGSTGLPAATFAWLGLGTVLFIGASILTNSLYGCERAPSAALAWLPAATVATVLFATADASPTAMAAGCAVGLALACALLLLAFLRALPDRSPVPAPPSPERTADGPPAAGPVAAAERTTRMLPVPGPLRLGRAPGPRSA